MVTFRWAHPRCSPSVLKSGGEYGPGIANYLFAGFSVLAVIMPGIFSGVILATEREANLLALKRALPLPPGATIVAKGGHVDDHGGHRRDPGAPATAAAALVGVTVLCGGLAMRRLARVG